MVDKNILDNLIGQDIKEMIDDKKITLEELDYSSLLKVFDYEIDMLCVGKGDMDLICKCSNLLDEMRDEPSISDERFKEIVDKVFTEHVIIIEDDKKRNRSAKRTVLRRIAIVAAIIITLFATTTLVAAAFGVNIFEYVGKLVRNDGGVIEENGITFYNADGTKEYASIEQLIESENLDILYPTQLPEGIYITKVKMDKALNGNETVTICTNDVNINIDIELSAEYIPTNNKDVYEHNGISHYIVYQQDTVCSYCQYNGNTYYFSSCTREDLILIINNIKER